MKANRTLLQMKYVRIISEFAKKSGLSTKEAMDFFYHSKEYELIRDGISDLHCMSAEYLAEDLIEEMRSLS